MEVMPSTASGKGNRFFEPWFPPVFKPEIDEKTGISFIDILFALVIGQVLLEVQWSSFYPVVTTRHVAMVVAAFVTIASWIGYNNSHNKPQYRIRFVNWPLIQFFIDILLVFFYWLMVVAAEDNGLDGSSPAVLARWLFAIFLLYVLWDFTSWRITKYGSPRVQNARHPRLRFVITIAFALFSAIAWIWASNVEMTTCTEYRIDLVLIGITLLFRIAKDLESRKRVGTVEKKVVTQ